MKSISLNYLDFNELDQNVPQWIPLVPIADRVQGRNGRYFTMDSPQAVIERTLNEYAMDLPVDVNHGSETVEGNGEAVGWVKEYKAENGYIYGRVEWTEKGLQLINSKTYRYISPCFNYEPAKQNSLNGKILFFTSIALTNRPNLKMHALNNAAATTIPQTQGEQNPMSNKIAKALGLPEDASEEQILKAIEEAKQQPQEKKEEAKPSDQPEPPKPPAEPPKVDNAPNSTIYGYVTQAQYDDLLKQHLDLQCSLNQAKATNQSTVIDDALKAGKIAPDQVGHWQLALNSFGHEYVSERLSSMAPIVNTAANQSMNKAATSKNNAITDEEVAMIEKMGLTIDEYKQAKETN